MTDPAPPRNPIRAKSEMLITLTELVVHGSPRHELRFTYGDAMKPLSEPAIDIKS